MTKRSLYTHALNRSVKEFESPIGEILDSDIDKFCGNRTSTVFSGDVVVY